jgi:hypothetical protein
MITNLSPSCIVIPLQYSFATSPIKRWILLHPSWTWMGLVTSLANGMWQISTYSTCLGLKNFSLPAQGNLTSHEQTQGRILGNQTIYSKYEPSQVNPIPPTPPHASQTWAYPEPNHSWTQPKLLHHRFLH